MVNGVPRGSPAAKTLRACDPSGFGLGTSLGTPFTTLPPRIFQIMSHDQAPLPQTSSRQQGILQLQGLRRRTTLPHLPGRKGNCKQAHLFWLSLHFPFTEVKQGRIVSLLRLNNQGDALTWGPLSPLYGVSLDWCLPYDSDYNFPETLLLISESRPWEVLKNKVWETRFWYGSQCLVDSRYRNENNTITADS